MSSEEISFPIFEMHLLQLRNQDSSFLQQIKRWTLEISTTKNLRSTRIQVL